jgi:hypothetical protein
VSLLQFRNSSQIISLSSSCAGSLTKSHARNCLCRTTQARLGAKFRGDTPTSPTHQVLVLVTSEIETITSRATPNHRTIG